MPNLLIENIDLRLLEKQRLALIEVLAFVLDRAATKEDLANANEVGGLLNMLDAWSDKTFVSVRVRVKEWFDKVNGNSYFSARVWVEDNLVVVLPLQYGYESHGVDRAISELAGLPYYPNRGEREAYWRYCEENKMKLEYDKEENCLKRDVKAFGEKQCH